MSCEKSLNNSRRIVIRGATDEHVKKDQDRFFRHILYMKKKQSNKKKPCNTFSKEVAANCVCLAIKLNSMRGDERAAKKF